MINMTSANARPVILVTDDLLVNRIALRKILKKVDADIVEAESGNEALGLALTTPNLALILMDVQMPCMSGFEAVKLLQEEDSTNHVPVIFITAQHRDEQNTLSGYSVGAVDYIHKPIDSNILLSKARVFLNIWQLQYDLEMKVLELGQAKQTIEDISLKDPLTKLPNRRLLFETIPNELARSKRVNCLMAILFIDLDGFKDINDTLGHDVGDELLIATSERLLNIVRPSDIVCRLGGDEFVIVLKDGNTSESIEPKLGSILAEISRPFQLSAHKVGIGCSMGISIYPEHGDDFESLLNAADEAMYEAKRSGKNTFRFYCNSLNKQANERLAIADGLRFAKENNELELYFQPIVEVSSGRLMGVEALLRWHSPVLGWVGPDVFIPIAESSGQMNKIGTWVLEKALQMQKRWNLKPELNLNMSINVSPIQFKNEELYALTHSLTQQGESLALVSLEITEGLLMEDSQKLRDNLIRLTKLDLRLSLDDFGTGYSSLSYLKRCPVSYVKIDRSFVSDLPGNKEDVVLVKTIIGMAHGLGKMVIAEGVETKEQWVFLQSLSCDYAQGYYFSKPLNEADFDRYLETASL